MKKVSKVLSIILLVAIVMTIGMGTVVNASEKISSGQQVNNLFTGGSANTTEISNVGANIVKIITTIGIIVAVIVLLILGIKYMMGSASEKAEYKKTMIPYLVGAILIFGASAIAKAVIAMSESIAGTI